MISTNFNSPSLYPSTIPNQPPQSLSHNSSITSLFQTCKSMKHLKQIHAQMLRTQLINHNFALSQLLSFCCTHREGDMAYAHLVFDQISEPDLFIWNTMITGHSRRNSPKAAFSLYIEMLHKSIPPDRYTFPSILKSLNYEWALKFGREIHAQVLKFGHGSDTYVLNSLIHVYTLCGRTTRARQLFDRFPERDVVSWNSMISGYIKRKQFREAVDLFLEMERDNARPNSVTVVSALSACAKLKDLSIGKRIHNYIKLSDIKTNLIIENALIDMYASCGCMDIAHDLFDGMNNRDIISWTSMVVGYANLGLIDQARKLFDQMAERDSISWTAMIDGCIRSNRFKEALEIFREMQVSKIRPDEYTMVSVLTACSHLGALEVGEWIRVYIERENIRTDVFVGNALIDMYSKCGNIDRAMEIFREMKKRDKFTWTSMIMGLGVHGHAQEALNLFRKMQRAGVRPDEITFIGLLCACTHAGMIEKGKELFSLMEKRYQISPNVVHYGCMVDLLGKMGHLKEAQELIETMPMKPNSKIWGTLLGACRVHKDIEIAEKAGRELVDLDPQNNAAYVLLSNLYASCNRWEEVRKLRSMMSEKGIKKEPGCSLIEINGVVHEFFAGDNTHPQSKKIYLKLEEMVVKSKPAGYIPDTSEVLLDIGEEERQSALLRHSEKLAIAFGLIGSKPKATIRIVKNLRMCGDCHSLAKFISKIYEREVIVRDKTRFHHFRAGSCSCMDYW
ncbi:putative pentatricopeptide repeat-containing protein At3g15930 [Amborella trichopoda]|uniref:putative pentatricopeptide repeat-containing protein At3g15930 n=1 Tax=Amborella trichopoda TaxID=13333 RepID=UPI0009BE4DBF|nr:putative pentatricopeptide repeat-containing protein At3g15930 [Amborella trichopoda]|eukprot:XP_011629220.2 putative pentatricopeptide repeat-containing protein At3g15930 [Amborella trichopoda]